TSDVVVHVCFFFQAEDGIRDWSVTGVQTCALPICLYHLEFQNTPACARAWQDHWCFGIPDGRDAHPSDVRPGLAGASALWDIPQIGRASCRERVESSGGAGGLEKK